MVDGEGHSLGVGACGHIKAFELVHSHIKAKSALKACKYNALVYTLLH